MNEFNIIKINNENPIPLNFKPYFEEFTDLYLNKLENKSKLNPKVRQKQFDYLNFHKKEKERIQRIEKLNEENEEILTLPEIPKSKKLSLSISSNKKESLNLSNKKLSINLSNNDIKLSENSLKDKKEDLSKNTVDHVDLSLFSQKTILSKKVDETNIYSFLSEEIENESKSVESPKILSTIISKNNYYDNSPKKSTHVSKISLNISTESINEDDEKRELLFKFQLLKKRYPEYEERINFNMRSNLKIMKNTYELILNEKKVTQKVNSLNQYLNFGFMLTEGIFAKLGFDMEGFAIQQIAMKNNYDDLLIELGEQNLMPFNFDKWSPLSKLIITLLFNAIIFIFSKKSNIDLNSMLNTVSGKKNNKKESDEIFFEKPYKIKPPPDSL